MLIEFLSSAVATLYLIVWTIVFITLATPTYLKFFAEKLNAKITGNKYGFLRKDISNATELALKSAYLMGESYRLSAIDEELVDLYLNRIDLALASLKSSNIARLFYTVLTKSKEGLLELKENKHFKKRPF